MRVHGFRTYGGEKHYLVNQRMGDKVYIPEWMTKLEAMEYGVVSTPCIRLEALLALRRLLDSRLSSLRDNKNHELNSHGDDNENLQALPIEPVSSGHTKGDSNTADSSRSGEGITGKIDGYSIGRGEEKRKHKRETKRKSVAKGGRS